MKEEEQISERVICIEMASCGVCRTFGFFKISMKISSQILIIDIEIIGGLSEDNRHIQASSEEVSRKTKGKSQLYSLFVGIESESEHQLP